MVPFMRDIEKYVKAREEANNMAPTRGILDKQAYTRASTLALLCPHPPTHTHTH